MESNVLMWLFAIILAFVTVLLAIDFLRGWRAGKRSVHEAEMSAEKESANAKKVSKLDTVKDAGIDLMGAPRQTFAATLPLDGKQLHLRVPTKSIADRFETIGKIIEHFEAKRQTIDDLEQLYIFAAMLLSNNIDGEDMTVSTVRERLTADDVVVFLTAYMEWLTEVISSKN